jgi:O-antigen ligase/tetratricopeptide (TPR) repeat protein
MEVLCLLALLLLLMGKGADKFYAVPGFVPLVFLAGYIVMQLVPMPPWMLRIISPSTYVFYLNTVFVAEPAAWGSLSLDAKATVTEFFRFTAYVAFYIVTVQLLSKKRYLKKTVAIVIIFTSFLAFFGILQHLLSNGRIYWIRELTKGGLPFGPYVNRNHFAGLMALIFPLVAGLFIFYKPRVSYVSFREKISEIFNLQRTNIYILLGFSVVLIGTSIFLTLSRGGIVSLCLSMIFFGLLVFGKGASRKRGILIVLICVLIVLTVGWFGWNPILERFREVLLIPEDTSYFRPVIWKDSALIIKDFPLTGTGFGSYMNVYPLYRTFPGGKIVDHAHNDYIEMLVTGGAIAFLLMLWFLVVHVKQSYRTFLTRHDLYSIYLYIGCLAGLLSMFFYSMTDFNLHIGANGLYFFFLLGVAVAAANTRLQEGLDGTYLKKTGYPGRKAVFCATVLLVACVIFYTGVIAGKVHFSSVLEKSLSRNSPEEDLVAARARAISASRYDPLEARYQYAAAQIETLLGNGKNDLRRYKRALSRNPLDSAHMQSLGLAMSAAGMTEKADTLLQSGITYDRRNPERYRTYAVWLLSHGKKQKGSHIIRSAIALDQRRSREYFTLMVLNGFSDEEMLPALPEKVEPRLSFAEYLSMTGNTDMAEAVYLDALRHVHKEDLVRPAFFYRVYKHYMQNGREEDALNVMRQALQLLPNNVDIRLRAADLYEKTGITYRAREEYETVLQIDPKNIRARKRLDALLPGKK